jgi:hypothetical protein
MHDRPPILDASVAKEKIVWRYFDFPKFVSVLERGALYFCRADQLGDPLEGSFTHATEVDRDSVLASFPVGVSRERLEDALGGKKTFLKKLAESMYINCWHLGDHESMAMWRGYGDGPYGVAIRSDFGVLNSALSPTACDFKSPIVLGKVVYLDYSSSAVRIPNEDNAYARFFCKHIAYAHEKEIRAVFMEPVSGSSPDGHFIGVDIDLLVKQVMVSPLAPVWFDQLVSSVCKRLGCAAEVTRSNVFGPPVF